MAKKNRLFKRFSNVCKKWPIVTCILIGICVTVFIIQDFVPEETLREYAFVPMDALSKPWTFVTSTFLHKDINHLMFNLVGLAVFGYCVETSIGKKGLLAAFLLAGILCNFGSILTIPAQAASIGASGAIMGVIGFLAVIDPFYPVRFFTIFYTPAIFWVIGYAVFNFIGLFNPIGIIDYGSHLFGLAAGILLGMIKAKVKLLSATILIIIVAVGIVASLFVRVPVKEPLWDSQLKEGFQVTSVSISSDGSYIAVGSYDNRVYLFHRLSDRPSWSYQTGNSVHSVAISPDGSYIVVGSCDSKIYFFSNADNAPLWSYSTGDLSLSVTISLDGNYSAAGDMSKGAFLFGRSDNVPLQNYEVPDGASAVAISSDGNYIVAGSFNNVYLFNKSSNIPIWNYNTGHMVFSVAISSDGEYIVAGSSDNKVYLFNKSSGVPLWNYETDGDVYSVAISSDGEYIVAGGFDSKVYLFNKSSRTPLWNRKVGWILSTSISSDGNYLAAGGGNSVYFFTRDSSNPSWRYETDNQIDSVAISSGGDYLAVGSGERVYLFIGSK